MRTYIVLVASLLSGLMSSTFWKTAFNRTGGITLSFSKFFPSVLKVFTDWHFWVGCFFAIFAVFSFFDILSHEKMSVTAPLYALGYILTLLVARFVLHEDVGYLRWLGVILIALGVFVVTKTR